MSDENKNSEEPKWERRELKLNSQMKEVCSSAIKATEAELAQLRRKLDKLKYGR